MTRTKLRDPDITNVDLVDRPANPGARVMLFKRDGSGAASESAGAIQESTTDRLSRWIAKKLGLSDQELEEVEKGEDGEAETFDEAFSEKLSDRVLEDLWVYTNALRESLDSILKDTTITDKRGMIEGSLDQFHSAVSSAAISWNQGRSVMKIGRAMSAERLNGLKTIVQSLQSMIDESEKVKEEEKPMPEEKKTEVTKTEEISKEDVLKSLDPTVRKMFDEMESRAQAAESVAKKVLDENITKAFIAKAEGYNGLGIKSDEFGAVLKSISEKAPEVMDKLEAVLSAANEAVTKSKMFEEVGSSRTGSAPASGNATWAKIQDAATNMVTKAGTPMSKEEAVAKYLETADGKALYDEYLKEREVR
jgi:hypothetical protein